MRIPRFYLPLPLQIGSAVLLSGAVFSHAVRVLRLRPGALLTLFNGEGSAFTATLTHIGKREAQAQVTAALPSETESPLRITLAQGISRGEKMDYTLQKAVELGVFAIQPLFSERSGVILHDERLEQKTQHWRGVVIGACEQCGRNQLPELREPMTLANWLSAQSESAPLRLLLDPLAERGLRGLEPPSGSVTLLVGPEGGLSSEEIVQALKIGFASIRLGPRILRTETAGLAAMAAMQALWGDWI